MQMFWKKETQETDRLLRIDIIEIKNGNVEIAVEYNAPGLSNGYTCSIQRLIKGDEQAKSLIKKFWSLEIFNEVLDSSRHYRVTSSL
jgi:hypothetical protein